MATQNPSKLATVMLQLFPFFTGTVNLSVKEIVANKQLIISALQSFAGKINSRSLCIDNGKLYANEKGFFIGGCSDERYSEIWKWFSDNFLSLTFVKGEGLHFSEHPIHRVICVATAITKLYSRFGYVSRLSLEQLDAIHNLKYNFEQWGQFAVNVDFSITLEEVALMQQLLTEWRDESIVSCNKSEQVWIKATIERIEMNLVNCLEYVNSIV